MSGAAFPGPSGRAPRLALLALMVVCFVDVMGQGLAFPIFDTLLLKPGSGFLPEATSRSRAELLYSVAIGTFFLTWLFGSIYVARLSDSIGRKRGILICLLGAFAGYALAAAAIPLRSYPLLAVSRAITGFTAGTQPIAAAATPRLPQAGQPARLRHPPCWLPPPAIEPRAGASRSGSNRLQSSMGGTWPQ